MFSVCCSTYNYYSSHVFRLLLQIASIIGKHLFVYGNLADASHVLTNVMQRPEVRYLANFADSSKQTVKYRQAGDAILANIKNYLNELMTTKGPRTTIAQRAYRTVVAACSGANLVANQLFNNKSTSFALQMKHKAFLVKLHLGSW